MQAQDMMISNVYKVNETDSVRSVIEKFIEYRISGLPVINDKNKVVAYVSDGDILRYIGRQKDIIVDSLYTVNVIKGDDEEFEQRVKKIIELSVLKIAKNKVITAAWDENIENVAATLGEKQIKKLPVERNGKLIGIISRGDVIRHTFKSIL
ncbi:CBS domain-containing protein [Virgibacillus ndiopensis]|uniref:CBS domain-containing protein n=1 Tax=Virgibacillus ndiopensis TaxID=2004408 RepID=UPI000C078E3B|nr:CBS domain-containing protein [Virgibacillus ndiopensis]